MEFDEESSRQLEVEEANYECISLIEKEVEEQAHEELRVPITQL